ncbi:MAG: DUF6106 family protein [Clostridiales bacterium]|nr:DUF6106 family protein [Clostridiales bacterium]MCD8155226.1 DUF6106 family protein [Clostridiales bacterium]
MSDLYSELLVKKKQTTRDQITKYGLIVLTVLMFAGGLLLNILLFIPAIALCIADYFLIPKTDLEYEYLFINGDIDIDMVISRSKRKKVKSLKISEADLVAPINSHRLDYYNSNTKLKTYDYSSGDPEHKRYVMITRDDSGTCRVILEPDEDMAVAMRNCAPSKVFLD